NYAMDMHLGEPSSLAPAPDPRLSPKWRILGYITATDCIFRAGQSVDMGETVCYGYVAQLVDKPGTFIAAIRGTDGILEWLEDACFAPTDHPTAGLVERGFF